MHREVNSGLSIAIIIFLALAVFTYSRLGINDIDKIYPDKVIFNQANQMKNIEQPSVAQGQEKATEKEPDACKNRIFEGDVAIRMWRDGEPLDSGSQGVVVGIVKEDLAKLPIIVGEKEKDSFRVKLVDATQEIELELDKHSKNNPAEITIKGYKYICQGMAFISLGSPLEALANI